MKIKIELPSVQQNVIQGNIIVLDSHYGNVWTNITSDLLQNLDLSVRGTVHVEIYAEDKLLYTSKVPFGNTFNDAQIGQPIMYINSLGNLALALNQGNFSEKFNIKPSHRVLIKKA